MWECECTLAHKPYDKVPQHKTFLYRSRDAHYLLMNRSTSLENKNGLQKSRNCKWITHTDPPLLPPTSTKPSFETFEPSFETFRSFIIITNRLKPSSGPEGEKPPFDERIITSGLKKNLKENMNGFKRKLQNLFSLWWSIWHRWRSITSCIWQREKGGSWA